MQELVIAKATGAVEALRAPAVQPLCDLLQTPRGEVR
ncbi:MAG: hypothetical protein K0Q92_2201 [Steroidobacteraceae bacterium]|jgi:hypothetical protein|nr:hypothetical protein [Steroidobacteraceae bacterium]